MSYEAIMYEVVELLRQYGAWIETHDDHGDLVDISISKEIPIPV